MTRITAASESVRHFADREKEEVVESNFLSNGRDVAVRELGLYVRRAPSGHEGPSAGANRLGRDLMHAIH